VRISLNFIFLFTIKRPSTKFATRGRRRKRRLRPCIVVAMNGAIANNDLFGGENMKQLNQKSDCEVAVIGAGPYGLAVAAHLKAASIETRVFGETMSFWRRHMPKGMKIRSSLTTTDLVDPKGVLSLQAYANDHGMRLTYPAPLEVFVSYGEWFQAHAVADLDTRRVNRIEAADGRFFLLLDDGEYVVSQRVVIATGLANQEFRPAQFAGLSTDLVSHTSEHEDLGRFRNKRVAVIGRGQSACESAALLNSAGADVELISRGDIHWLGSGSADTDRPTDLIWRLHKILASRSGVGSFPFDWLADLPGVVRHLPPNVRARFTAHCLRAAATRWLKPRFEGVKTGPARHIVGACTTGSQVSLQFDNGSATFDHILLATGYHINIAKLGLLAPELLEQVHCANDSPLLSTGLESSMRGLHFVGASSVESHGPLMRFVAGSGYAARHVTQALLVNRALPRRTRSEDAHKPVFVDA
jgi:cation diffusion facilitator CzcD-associated flavoprotein CzcO